MYNEYQITRNSIIRIMLICFLILIFNTAFSQCEIIKTNLSSYIKSSLLAPTSFKIHRYSCDLSSPNVQKLQADLKKRKADIKNRYSRASMLTDSLNMLYSELNLVCDSLNRVISNSPNRIEKKRLEAKIRETKVINVPKDHEFILWQAARGIDTTMSSLAYSYTNELKKIPEDPNEQTYKEYKSHIDKLSTNIANANKILSILISQSKLVDIYLEDTKDLPIYKAYIVYQALTKGGTNNLSEEQYYFNKNYKCLGTDYTEFWNELSILD